MSSLENRPSYEGEAPTGAAVVILDDHKNVLVIKENYDRRRWGLPGGAIEPGETSEEAAQREAREETGVEVELLYLIGRYAFLNGLTVDAFGARIADGVPGVPATEEIAAVEWLPAKDLPQPRSNILHYAVPDALSGARDLQRRDLPTVS